MSIMKYVTLPEPIYMTMLDATRRMQEDIESGIGDGMYEDSPENAEDLKAFAEALSYQPTVDEVPDPPFASLDELKAAVKAGNSVHWDSDDYLVINRGNAWLIRQAGPNPREIGLTWSDGVTLNNHATLDQFYISNTEIIPYK